MDLTTIASTLPNIDLSILGDDQYLLEQGDKGLDRLAQICGHNSYIHPEWGLLGGRILLEKLKKKLPNKFSVATKDSTERLNPKYVKFVSRYADDLDRMIVPERDHRFDVFAMTTMLRSNLLRIRYNDTYKVMETPQYMYMRIAVFLAGVGTKRLESDVNDVELLNRIRTLYTCLSNGDLSMASPITFHAGTKYHQMQSCFVMTIPDDMVGIADSWSKMALISMRSGGIGCNYSSLRHSEIGTFGMSKGVVSWAKISNEIMQGVDQGGRRKGSQTAFIRDCHVDVMDFIELKLPGGSEKMRARDMTYAICASDLFMRRVENDEEWSLFCPNRAKGLFDTFGQEFEELYKKYENQGIASKTLKARDVWMKMIQTQFRTGGPFVFFIDNANHANNQSNIGLIRTSNLCMEIMEHTDNDTIATCTLGAVVLSKCCVRKGDKYKFDFDKLGELTKTMVDALDNAIEVNLYHDKIPEIERTSKEQRALGIGVMGFADVLELMEIPIDSYEARVINSQIFEVMYYNALEESHRLAEIRGPYKYFEGSPISRGQFQFEMTNWLTNPSSQSVENKLPRYYNEEQWDDLRMRVKQGVRNSLLIAVMPTASSAQLLGVNESIEPRTQMIFARTVLSGQFMVVNPNLVKRLMEFEVWNSAVVKNILANNGSVQNLTLEEVNSEGSAMLESTLNMIKAVYKTAYEIPQKVLLQHAADRGRFVCQSQSLNCWMNEPDVMKLHSYLLDAWKKGLKTVYYVRLMAEENPLGMGVDTQIASRMRRNQRPKIEVCTSCSV